MDTLTHYRQIVRQLMEEYAQFKPSHGQIDVELIIDEDKGHYELMYVGWDAHRRVHGSVIHIDIISDKVWIQHDGTSAVIADELVEKGIPREAIVLGFRPEHVRPHTGFAVA